MNRGKILKIAKGLGKFHLDEILIISELPENVVIKEIEDLLAEKVIGNIDNQTFIFLGYANQNKVQRKKPAKRFSNASDNAFQKLPEDFFLTRNAKNKGGRPPLHNSKLACRIPKNIKSYIDKYCQEHNINQGKFITDLVILHQTL